jgi:hypothetical protein
MRSIAAGMRVEGAQTRTSAASAVKARMFERATRLWSRYRTAAAANGERVEQSLGRVLVAAVAGVEDRAIDLVGDQPHGARAHMADDDHIGAHRVQRHCRVDERLALLHARLGCVHVDDIGPEPLPGDLEGEEGAGRVLEERVDLREALESLVALGATAVHLDPLLGLVEQEHDLVRLQSVDAGEVPVRKDCAAFDLGGGAMI